SDSIEALTEMLHEAYAPLAAAGMRFFASHQSVDDTRRRMARGDTIVGLDDALLVGTITLAEAAHTAGCPHYDRPDVASVQQFAVRPSHQRCGIGGQLLRLAERRAVETGAVHLALDTSERAGELIAMYERHGYRFVEHAQWPDVNYRSVVLSKTFLSS
ncbi:MAG TPA: GNAT family N-acetyltransferase, partial [Vicinamibacterales bacterium]|nr:GNAT family N-acetyltransferase [Vicinamibacterales bacterium]